MNKKQKVTKTIKWMIISTLFCLFLLCSFAMAETYSGEWGNLHWEIDEEGTLTISGTGSMNNFSSIQNLWSLT